MAKLLKSLLRQLVFWILFFAFARTIYLVYNYGEIHTDQIPFFEIIAGYWHGLKLDIATACYFLVFPLLLILVQSAFNLKWLDWVNRIYTSVIIILYSLITSTELGIYPEWKTKLHYKALMYFSHPTEIYSSADSSTFFILLLIAAFMATVGIFMYRKYFYEDIKFSYYYWMRPLGIAVVAMPLMFVGMRGGFQQIPINQSQSYYSNYNILNLAAVNSGFNLFISVSENLNNLNKNPFEVYSKPEAEAVVKKIFATPKDTTLNILTTKRPNIVLIILESWSADLIESLGGKPGITPQFRKLEKGGVLFTNLISSGTRSEQGMACIFGGFPGHAISSITVQPDKYPKMPSLNKTLKQQGYQTSYYYGGQLIYGNIKGYIMSNGFDRIREVYDFGNDVIKGKLGVHDEFVLERQHQELNKTKQPFFSALFTLSSHSPFDQPMPEMLHWNIKERKYINSAYYTDDCLGKYFEKVRKEPWYKNTLFILVADHSHGSYKDWPFTTPNYHRIPMLFYGDVIKPEYRGYKCNKLGGHHDLPATLLHQLSLNAKPFKWSVDLLNPYSPAYGYFSFEEGVGWVRNSGFFSYDERMKHYHQMNLPPAAKDSIVKEGKSYLQVLFDDYMHY
ncbi:MAG: sulfatase-like hydrolase/transferase [Bacteroidota bacterium]|nr:sulfatase-like hydrolase/transferase [Bacteroidota bacterium]